MFQKSSETDSDLYMNNIYKYTVSVSNFNFWQLKHKATALFYNCFQFKNTSKKTLQFSHPQTSNHNTREALKSRREMS